MAEWTGLEPATPGVTGRYSNQLNYHSKNFYPGQSWWVLTGSNRRHSPCKGDALPTELSTPCNKSPLVYSILERFASSELRRICSLNLDSSASARIATIAGSTLSYIKRTEANQGNHLSLLQGFSDCCCSCIQRTTCSSF